MRFFDNMAISRKIWGGFGVVLALLLVMGAFGGWSVSSVGGLFTDYRQLARASVEAGNVRARLLETRLAIRTFLQSGNGDAADTVRTLGDSAIESVEEVKSLVDSEEARGQLDAVEGDFRSYIAAFEDVATLQAAETAEYAKVLETGEKIEAILTDVMDGTYRAADSIGAYDAGVALRSLMLARLYSMKFLFTNAANDRARVGTELAALTENIDRLLFDIENPSRKPQIEEALALAGVYALQFDALAKAVMDGKEIVATRIDVLDPRIAAGIGAFSATALAAQEELGPDAVRAIDQTLVLTLVLGAMALLLGGAAAYFISRGISRPIVSMTGAMQRLAEKDLSVDVPAADQRDEIGDMARAVLVFRENMRRADELAVAQEKEREARDRRTARIEELNRSFDAGVSQVLDGVGSAVTELETTARSMSSIAEQTSAQANAVAAASEQSTTSVHTVSASAEELSSSIQEIARQIAHSSALTSNASSRAVETQGVVSGLSSSVDKIGDIVSLITDIAEQTNLLALNATIEAARAGEAGKGFAVVATEVKNLATQTAKATEEISRQIGEVQAETKRAVPSIDEIVKAIEEVNQVASSIASAVEEQSAATDEIAQNVQQVASGASEISQNISGMSRASSEANGAAGHVLDSTRHLSRQSEELRALVGSFIADVRAA